MIFYINSELKDEDVIAEIYTRNLGGSETPEDEFNKEFQIRTRTNLVEKKAGRNISLCNVQL